MPLHAHGVNLWKTCEVSYLQLDSYSTASVSALCANSPAVKANWFAKMVLLLGVPAPYPCTSNLERDSG